MADPRGRWLASIVAAPLALALVASIAPRVPLAPLPAYLLAFACVAAEVLCAAALAPRLRARALAWLVVPLGSSAGVVALGDALPELAAAALVTSSLLFAGTLLGSVVGGAVEHAGHLVIVAVVSALVDVFSVLHPSGPTAQIVRIEAAVSVLALPWPMLGTARVEPILGIGDVTFAAIYLAAARRHALSRRRTLLALACGLAVTLVVVVVAERGVPALPFLGAAFVLAHPEARRVPPGDRRAALLGVVGIVLLFAALLALR